MVRQTTAPCARDGFYIAKRLPMTRLGPATSVNVRRRSMLAGPVPTLAQLAQTASRVRAHAHSANAFISSGSGKLVVRVVIPITGISSGAVRLAFGFGP